MSIPDEVLEVMASSMLEPKLGKKVDQIGNHVRKEVLQRALAAAEEIGWTLRANV